MRTRRRKTRVAGITAIVVGAVLLAMATSALAVTLYWGSTAVKTASVAKCLGFAETAMHGLSFQNIRKSPNEVAGSSGGAYAAVTCFATAPRATAIVMVAGNDAGETARVRDSLRQKIAAVVSFD